MKKAIFSTFIVLSLINTHLPVAYSKVIPKAGSVCTKLKSTQVVGNKKFTCIKSGSKLIWDKGVTIVNSNPTPISTPTPIASPSPVVVAENSNKSQVINFEKISDQYLLDNSIKLSITATSGLPVVIKTESSVICRYKADSSELFLESAGTCTVVASQAGNNTFKPAETITRTFEIKKKDQNIIYKPIKDLIYSKNIADLEFIPSASSSLNVTLAVTDKSICTVQNGKVKILKVGACDLQLSQSGNRFYNAAPNIKVSFNIIEPEHAGTSDDPQIFLKEITKNGITIKVNSVTDDVSEFVCKTELIQDGCEFGGTVDADSYTRFVKIEITVKNKGAESWQPSIFGLYLEDQLFGGDFIENDKVLDNYELSVDSTANLSLYVALEKEIKLSDCLLFISESVAEEAFYFKLK